MIADFQRLWQRLSDIGLRDALSESEKRKTRLINQTLLLTAPLLLVLVVYNLLSADWMGLGVDFIFVGLFALNFFYHRRGWLVFSRWYLVVTLLSSLTLVSWLYGPGLGSEFAFLIISVVILIIFEGKKLAQFCLLGFVLGTYAFISWSYLYHSPPFAYLMNPFLIHIVFLTSMGAGLLFIKSFIVATRTSEQRTRELLTAYKHQNKALIQANEDLERFAYAASHDLKTPLRNINSFLNLIERRLPPAAYGEVAEYLTVARDNSLHMYHLTGDILKYSMISPLDSPEHIDLNLLMRKVCLDMHDQLKQAHKTLEIGRLPAVVGNAEQLRLVFRNLIENGFKYNQSEEARVCISSRETKQWTCIRFADNGIGIDPAYREQVFDMFCRLHPQDQYPGTGMGLTIVQKIVSLHEGEIEILAYEPQGTVVEVRLPKNQEPQPQSHEV